ncbi:MAG: hypothetical protein JRD88_06980 [Deltaproteobacteria bacterium]|jgi:hypothetical protein|nr:hypothetical protein [Deltaproteobacteria bacterium]
MRGILSALLALALVGCAGKYDPSVVQSDGIKTANLKEIAEIDESIIDFAQDVYLDNHDYKVNQYVIADSETLIAQTLGYDIRSIDYIDTEFFKTYCESRDGDVYRWVIEKAYERLWGRGVGKKFYTCEVDSEVEAALVYEVGKSGPFYKIDKIYLTNQGFEKYREYYKAFMDTEEMVFIDKGTLYSPNNGLMYASYMHPFFLSLENTSEQDLIYKLDNISIQIGDSKITPKLVELNSSPVKSRNELIIKPGDKLTAELSLKMPGLNKIKVDDVLNSVIVINGREHTQFIEIDSYQREKVKLNKINEVIATK